MKERLDWEFVFPELLKSKMQLSDRWYQLILNMIKSVGLDFSKAETKILEVGCGIGGFCIFASERCEDVTGLDIGKTRISMGNKLRKSLGRKVGFVVGDAQFLPFRDGCFHVTVCSETLEHIPDYRKTFEELVRVTKRLGYVVVTVPNNISLAQLDKLLMFPLRFTVKESQPEDLHFFNTFVVDRLFQRKELKVMIKQGVDFIYIPSSRPKIKSIESLLNRLFGRYPRRLSYLCLNIGIIAQKTE
jgi:ubiquinone/menaquinone biosynthesis C-methylase UbiE